MTAETLADLVEATQMDSSVIAPFAAVIASWATEVEAAAREPWRSERLSTRTPACGDERAAELRRYTLVWRLATIDASRSSLALPQDHGADHAGELASAGAWRGV